MVRDKIQHLAHAVRLQLRHPGIIIRARTDHRIQLVVISDVVAVQALGAGLKIRRRIYIAYSERVQIRDSFARLRKREPPIELQPVGAGGNARMPCFHGGEANVQRPTPNVQRRMKESADTFGVLHWGSAAPERHESGSAFSLHSSLGTCKKVAHPHFLKKFLKLFRSDLERTGKDTTLNPKTLNL